MEATSPAIGAATASGDESRQRSKAARGVDFASVCGEAGADSQVPRSVEDLPSMQRQVSPDCLTFAADSLMYPESLGVSPEKEASRETVEESVASDDSPVARFGARARAERGFEAVPESIKSSQPASYYEDISRPSSAKLKPLTSSNIELPWAVPVDGDIGSEPAPWLASGSSVAAQPAPLISEAYRSLDASLSGITAGRSYDGTDRGSLGASQSVELLWRAPSQDAGQCEDSLDLGELSQARSCDVALLSDTASIAHSQSKADIDDLMAPSSTTLPGSIFTRDDETVSVSTAAGCGREPDLVGARWIVPVPPASSRSGARASAEIASRAAVVPVPPKRPDSRGNSSASQRFSRELARPSPVADFEQRRSLGTGDRGDPGSAYAPDHLSRSSGMNAGGSVASSVVRLKFEHLEFHKTDHKVFVEELLSELRRGCGLSAVQASRLEVKLEPGSVVALIRGNTETVNRVEAAVIRKEVQLTVMGSVGRVEHKFTISYSDEAASPSSRGRAEACAEPFRAWLGAPLHLEPRLDRVQRGTRLRFSVTPRLPSGISIDEVTGVISGRPEQTQLELEYEVTARTVSISDAIVPATARCSLALGVRAPPSPSAKRVNAGGSAKIRRVGLITRELPGADASAKSSVRALSAEDAQRAFDAVRAGAMADLLVMVDSGILLEKHLRSPEVVDRFGLTLMDVAQSCGHRRVLNYFRNGLEQGPSLMSPRSEPAAAMESPPARPWPTRMGARYTDALCKEERWIPADTSETVPERKSRVYELSYPSCPEVIKSGHIHKFLPVLLEDGKSFSAAQSQMPLRFALHDSEGKPLGGVLNARPGRRLAFCHETGAIGLQLDEDGAEDEYVVTMRVGADVSWTSTIASVSCRVRVLARMPPSRLSYATVERSFDSTEVSLGEVPFSEELPPVLMANGRPADRTPRQRRRSVGLVTPAESSGHQRLVAMPEVVGAVERFEMVPRPPAGMVFDTRTGAIRGLPEESGTFPHMYRQSFDIHAYNEVGSTSCKVSLEVIAGLWGITRVKLHTSSGADSKPAMVAEPAMVADLGAGAFSRDCSPGTQSGSLWSGGGGGADAEALVPVPPPGPATASARPQGREDDLHTLVDRCAVVLGKLGRTMPVQDAGGASGIKVVKGMRVGEILAYLRLRNEDPQARRLIHAVSSAGVRADRLRARGLEVDVVEAEPGASPRTAVVYLASFVPPLPGIGTEPALPPQRPVSQGAPSGGALAAGPAAIKRPSRDFSCDAGAARRVAPKAKMGGAEAAQVNEEFARLLPMWRSKMEQGGHAGRYNQLRTWRAM
eukprot:TRINITY_DN5810_c0_g2_i1.p1 TRINITY_DN5810_c0_g2~~TRINITY_DN5810_c0_g2_i1.p1  ORF type:complete len:1362 (-),score=248.80 TRINITY_DN5810_c0_g2_i1:108-4013(-)